MDIHSTTLIYFSPTRTTKRVLEAIALGVSAARTGRIDLTPPSARTCALPEVDHGLAIIGAPVYAGRIPLVAAQRLRRLQAHQVPAAVVVVYGNREYEDALIELRDIAIEVGLVPVAGAAFVGEHSYDSADFPIATGRPDEEDLQKAEDFGALVHDRVKSLRTLDSLAALQVPGDTPYCDRFELPTLSPVTREELCTRCDLCAAACPVAAIDIGDSVTTDEEACILCSACVKACPTGARAWEHPWVRRAARWLAEDFAARKEPEVYM